MERPELAVPASGANRDQVRPVGRGSAPGAADDGDLSEPAGNAGPHRRGVGETDFEALYDLLGGLYVVPRSESLPLRLATFGKLLLDGVPFSKAKQLFQKDKPNQREAQVMALSPGGWHDVTLEVAWEITGPGCWYISTPGYEDVCLVGLFVEQKSTNLAASSCGNTIHR